MYIQQHETNFVTCILWGNINITSSVTRICYAKQN